MFADDLENILVFAFSEQGYLTDLQIFLNEKHVYMAHLDNLIIKPCISSYLDSNFNYINGWSQLIRGPHN